MHTSLALGDGALYLQQPTEQFLSLPLPTLPRLWADECSGLQIWHSMAIPMQDTFSSLPQMQMLLASKGPSVSFTMCDRKT